MKLLRKTVNGLAGGLEQLRDLVVTVATLFNFSHTMAQGRDEGALPLRILQQIVFQIRIALHDPDITQDLVQHARRAAGDAFATECVQKRPVLLAEQANDDLSVRVRGVVVGDLAEACVHGFVLVDWGP